MKHHGCFYFSIFSEKNINLPFFQGIPIFNEKKINRVFSFFLNFQKKCFGSEKINDSGV